MLKTWGVFISYAQSPAFKLKAADPDSTDTHR